MVQRIKLATKAKGEEGIALVAVIVMVSIIAATTADLAYETQVDYAAATNARDELRAHYLARSAINLSQMLMTVQDRLVSPNKKMLGGMDIQVADYASMMAGAFGNSDEADALGSLLGVSAGPVKGLGVDFGTIDLVMQSLDGKLNINCGGGTNPGSPAVIRTAATLAALLVPERYNILFEQPKADGQFYDRQRTVQSIIDWADQDMAAFGTSTPEAYDYESGSDPYQAKNQYYDTLSELRLVASVDEDIYRAFKDSLTVYGSCKVNLSLASPALIAALIMQHAANPQDPALRWENVAMLARVVVQISQMSGGFKDLKSFAGAVEDPMNQLQAATAFNNTLSNGEGTQANVGPIQVTGIKLNTKKLNESVLIGSVDRRIWKISATSEVGRVHKTITAVWDARLVSNNAARRLTRRGGFVYWREE